jgi:hypothetical protein
VFSVDRSARLVPSRIALRPAVEDLGLNRLTLRVLVTQSVLAVVCFALMPRVRLTIAWSTVLPFLIGDIALASIWVYFWRVPGRPKEWIIPETLAALLLLLMVTHILSPAQYVAVALKRPLVDHALASADAMLGIDVTRFAAWSLAHPRINLVMAAAYYSFVPQLAALVALLGIVLRDREALWEYVFHFYVCSTVTVVSLALFPAACAFQYLGFTSSLNQSRFIAHFNGLRAGTMTVIRFDDMEGLVSMPSLHMAGALMVLWALRGHPKALIPAALLNGLLIAATALTGAHYAVDLLATLVMFGGSVALWRRHGRALIVRRPTLAVSP